MISFQFELECPGHLVPKGIFMAAALEAAIIKGYVKSGGQLPDGTGIEVFKNGTLKPTITVSIPQPGDKLDTFEKLLEDVDLGPSE